jgi:hypothetical protein
MRNGAHIDAARRFVEDDDRGLLHQRFGQHDLLLVFPGQFDDARFSLQRVDLQPFDPIIRELAATDSGEQETPAEAGGEAADIDVVVHDHRLEKAVRLAILGDVSDAVIDRLSRQRQRRTHRFLPMIFSWSVGAAVSPRQMQFSSSCDKTHSAWRESRA